MSDLEFDDFGEREGAFTGGHAESTEIRESAFLDPELSTMLAILGPAHTPMPADVWARMQAALVVESAARETGADTASNAAPLAPAGFQAADDNPAFGRGNHGADSTGSTAAESASGDAGDAKEYPFPPVNEGAEAANIVSLADRVRGRTRVNFIAAAAIAAVAGGVWLINGNQVGDKNPATNLAQENVVQNPVRTAGDGGVVAGTDGPATADSATTKIAAPVAIVAVSGKDYHLDSLGSEAEPLASGDLQPNVDASDVPMVFAKQAECVQAEVSRLAFEDPNTKVTADMGFIDGQPVGVVVETNTADASAPAKVFITDSSGSCSLKHVDDLSR